MSIIISLVRIVEVAVGVIISSLVLDFIYKEKDE